MYGDGHDREQGLPAQATHTMSETISKLTNALAKAQGRIQIAEKSSFNPHFKSRYADLASVWAACREPLAMYGLAVIQPVSCEGNAVTVTTLLTHESGEWIRSAMTANARDSNPQSMGSVVTYLRRYSLASMVGVATGDDDDDAETATNTGGGSNPGADFNGPANGPPAQVDRIAVWTPRIREAKTMTDLNKVAAQLNKEKGNFSRREHEALAVVYAAREAEIGPPKGKPAPKADAAPTPCSTCGDTGHPSTACPNNDGKTGAAS